MDILRFVNSNAIREHLREINYQFNTLEAAFLIAKCRSITIKERHNAWQGVIDTMPDMSPAKEMPNCRFCYYPDSIHAYLKKVIENENRILDMHLLVTDGAFNLICFGDEVIMHNYADLSDSVDDLYSTMFRYIDEGDGWTKYEILCKPKHQNIVYSVFYNDTGKLIDLKIHKPESKEDDLSEQFDNMWFDIPAPFKKGDILYNPLFYKSKNMPDNPFVYESSAAEYYKEKGIKGGCDITDMSVSGYFQDEHGNLCGDNVFPYLSLEYYPVEKLTGFNKALIALSNHLKGEIDDVLFARAYHYILTNEYANITKPESFTDEGLILAGIKTEEEIEDDTDDLPF